MNGFFFSIFLLPNCKFFIFFIFFSCSRKNHFSSYCKSEKAASAAEAASAKNPTKNLCITFHRGSSGSDWDADCGVRLCHSVGAAAVATPGAERDFPQVKLSNSSLLLLLLSFHCISFCFWKASKRDDDGGFGCCGREWRTAVGLEVHQQKVTTPTTKATEMKSKVAHPQLKIWARL